MWIPIILIKFKKKGRNVLFWTIYSKIQAANKGIVFYFVFVSGPFSSKRAAVNVVFISCLKPFSALTVSSWTKCRKISCVFALVYQAVVHFPGLFLVFTFSDFPSLSFWAPSLLHCFRFSFQAWVLRPSWWVKSDKWKYQQTGRRWRKCRWRHVREKGSGQWNHSKGQIEVISVYYWGRLEWKVVKQHPEKAAIIII